MFDVRERTDALEAKLRAEGMTKYAVDVGETEKHELNTEDTSFVLYRTLFDQSAAVTVFRGTRKGTASGNDLSDAGLDKLVADAISGAESAMEDDANDIAENQGKHVFHNGPETPDMDALYARMEEFIGTVTRDFPQIRLSQNIAVYTRSHSLYRNSNGSDLESFDGSYDIGLEFAGNDGERTTGLAYTSVSLHDLDTPIIDHGMVRRSLEDTQKSLHVYPLTEKFTGPVIFTPDALGYFTWMLIGNFMSDEVVMAGTSQWLDRVGEKVASDKVTLRLQAKDDRLVASEPWTDDGYLSEDLTLIEKGVLNRHLLSLYAAKKTGREVAKNTSSAFVMESGETPLAEMIKGIDKGLIVGGFSGGEPGANGEFSGVAKNSFYVENGEIRGAVMETMINGNLQDIFSKVSAVSKELVSDGSSAFPYLKADGIVISGSSGADEI